jgi:hypothetical protein
MADDTPTTPNKGRRRPPPTIDLSATEVKPTEPAPPKPEAVAPSTAAPNSFARYAGIAAALVGGVALTLAVMWFATHLPGGGSDAALRDRIAVLELQLNAAPKAADSTALAELSQRIGKIEQALAKPPSADSALGERLAAIENSMKAFGVTLTALNRRAEDSAGAIAGARERAEAAATASQVVQARLEKLEQSSKAAQEKVAQNSVVDAVARRALAAVALRDALMRGTSYAAELGAVKGLGADAKLVAGVEPFAETGVATDAALAREFHALLPALIEATGAVTAPTGFFDRLQANAGKLVRVYPVGEPPGDDAAAVLARIEVKVARNDAAGIDAELAKLPPKARALTAGWSKKFAARNAALDAGRKLTADSAAALGAH